MSTKPVPEINDLNRIFYEGTAKGELRLCRCRSCGELFRFTHPLCPKCWSNQLDHVVASGKGKVESFTIAHMPPYDAWAADVPYVIALVMLDEGVRMMANVAIDGADIAIDMPVEVWFERRGAVAIPQFRPALQGSSTA